MYDGHQVNEIVMAIISQRDACLVPLTEIAIQHGVEHRRVGTHYYLANMHLTAFNLKYNIVTKAKRLAEMIILQTLCW